MSRIIKLFTTIRNNWKKSVVGAAAFTYGVNYGIESYDTEQLMREYCEEAAKFGAQPLRTSIPPRHVTVILNPVAKKRKAKKLFEKYCEPLLHLAGISVTIIQTESEGQARSLIENLETPTDAIIVAGGDGTLADVVTGLMRKYSTNLGNVKKCPIGVLPLGQTNRLADSLFEDYNELADVHKMADATMAVVRGATKAIDAVEVQPLEKDPENDIKPVYAVGIIEWGAWRDAESRVNKYWYWGYLRKYVTYIFTGYKKDVNWDCNATVRYSEPCHGCSRCYKELHSTEETNTTRRWWQAFLPRKVVHATGPDYSKIVNDKCGELHELPISATELHLTTDNIENVDPHTPPSIKLQLGPETISYTDFIAEGWRRVRGDNKPTLNEALRAKQIELIPNKAENFGDKEQMFSIDNDEFELKPLKIRLLSKAVTIFCSQLES
ncbi:acylglycerol kinase, mitochondrial [Venturia canescens]|uniref:acylglycerol kinase, mitochondrial n=1 Tax=Venturia canescens TaxID=32260 RepID=UPI001C9C6AA5|nr:acylglycerol kinase, mitochondrial [Venturia canescens]